MSFNSPGRKIKPQEMEDFTPITSVNRKNAVILGRILYVIDDLKIFKGYISIRPRLVKGRLKIEHLHEPNQNYWLKEDETLEDYKSSFDKLITLQIETKQLFFKLKDPLIKYNYDKAQVR